tara:strand:+ start:2137 stop:2694 length:558 start_codon:yes stop_codon:yes gene_type:complete
LLNRITLYFILFFSLNFQNLIADDKKNIIQKLINTNSIKFNFEQKTNEDIENGFCHLKFQNKLKCIYDDDKKKEMIINENNLIIFQKRYDKKYYYPVSKSMFKQILNKEELISLINKSEIELKNNEINLINYDNKQNKIIILFNKENYDFLGWKIQDQFNNRITFIIEILSVNHLIDDKIFKIPE